VNFELEHQHRMAQRMVRDFAQREVAPHIREWDRRQTMDPAILRLEPPSYPFESGPTPAATRSGGGSL
jgi:alkylation response protein AidB-like acyl-CoA dehydrogenase